MGWNAECPQNVWLARAKSEECLTSSVSANNLARLHSWMGSTRSESTCTRTNPNDGAGLSDFLAKEQRIVRSRLHGRSESLKPIFYSCRIAVLENPQLRSAAGGHKIDVSFGLFVARNAYAIPRSTYINICLSFSSNFWHTKNMREKWHGPSR